MYVYQVYTAAEVYGAYDIIICLKELAVLDTLQRGVQWEGGAVDWGSII